MDNNNKRKLSSDLIKESLIYETELIGHSAYRRDANTQIIPSGLKNKLKLEPIDAKRAGIVYNTSISVLKKLFDNPDEGNVDVGTAEIYEIVDCIIDDHNMTRHLVDITSHDFYTYTHSVNVGILSVLLAKRLYKSNSNHNLKELGAGFFLHDIGKVNIDSTIINKRGKLSEDEIKIMRRHPSLGSSFLLENGKLTKECSLIVAQHHEREDGLGYPSGLRSREIHDYGRICAIADVFDALTSKRSYKNSMEPFSALRVMKEKMINHFNREIFENFAVMFN